MEADEIKKQSEAREISNKVNELNKKATVLKDKCAKAIKDSYIEEIAIRKFITEQELKNIDVILDILKVATSLSISIFIASLTTTYFNEKIYIIICINIISAILLIAFIDARNKILLKSKTTLLNIFNKSTIETFKDVLSETEKIKLKLAEQKNLIKDLQK